MRSTDMHKLLEALRHHFDTTPAWAHRILENQEKILMAISAEVQKVIDDIAANTSIAKASAAALVLEAQQITDLQAQIAALQAGTVLSAEDKAALVQGAADLESTNTALQTATPANTTKP